MYIDIWEILGHCSDTIRKQFAIINLVIMVKKKKKKEENLNCLIKTIHITAGAVTSRIYKQL